MTTSTFQGSSTKTKNLKQAYNCNKCKDKCYILIDDLTARVCSCQEQKRIERLFRGSQITPAFQGKTFKNFSEKKCTPAVLKMYLAAKAYTRDFNSLDEEENNWLVFLGQPGAGKSHLSLAVGNTLIQKGVPVLYFQHVEGINEMKDIIRRDGEESIGEKTSEMKKVDFLIWDDLFKPLPGQKEVRPFEVQIAFEVLNYRYLNLLPTAINSERTPKELVTIDEATGSRIIERGKGRMVVVEGLENNWRLKPCSKDHS